MKVFVYGTLKAGFWNNRILSGCTHLGEAVLDGYHLEYSYDKGSFPFAVPNPSEKVVGEVWDIGDDRMVLERLDGLEGHPNGYKRTPVLHPEHGEVSLYVWHHETDGKRTSTLPSGEYIWQGE